MKKRTITWAESMTSQVRRTGLCSQLYTAVRQGATPGLGVPGSLVISGVGGGGYVGYLSGKMWINRGKNWGVASCNIDKYYRVDGVGRADTQCNA